MNELNSGRRTWAEQGGAAFPVPDRYAESGMPLLLALASQAPAEVPGWFSAIYKPVRACPPVRDVKDAPADIRAEVAQLVLETDLEPEWWEAKHPDVKAWMDGWHSECEAAANWKMYVREPDRYFAWRIYFAQSLMAYAEGGHESPRG